MQVNINFCALMWLLAGHMSNNIPLPKHQHTQYITKHEYDHPHALAVFVVAFVDRTKRRTRNHHIPSQTCNIHMPHSVHVIESMQHALICPEKCVLMVWHALKASVKNQTPIHQPQTLNLHLKP